MIKTLTFDLKENNYVILDENKKTLFSMNSKTLNFNSQKFYDGIFSNIGGKTKIKFISDLQDDGTNAYSKSLKIYQDLKDLIEGIEKDINIYFTKLKK